jgi:hypothetical protein
MHSSLKELIIVAMCKFLTVKVHPILKVRNALAVSIVPQSQMVQQLVEVDRSVPYNLVLYLILTAPLAMRNMS